MEQYTHNQEDLIQPPISPERRMLNKVPQVTIFFWIIKIMATTVGETAADLLNENLNLGLGVTTLLMTVLLIVALVLQFKADKYVPWIYWLSVVLISVVGTLITDNLTDNLGVPLETSTMVFSILLIAVFVVWYASEKTLSIHSITTQKREAFYWLSILCTFALGTAAGDLIAETMNLGYLVSSLMFASVIGVISLVYYGFKLNAVLAFWLAYILTRPFGASLGDYLSQAPGEGGLGLGTVGTSAFFLVIIVALIIYLSRSQTNEIPPGPHHSAGK